MLFRLCLAVGCWHPKYLKEALSSREIADWIAYERIEPWGMQYAELLQGIQTAAIVNSNGAKPPARAAEFMPSFREPIMSAEEVFEAFRGARKK